MATKKEIQPSKLTAVQAREKVAELQEKLDNYDKTAFCLKCKKHKDREKGFYLNTDPMYGETTCTPICRECARKIALRVDKNGEEHEPTKESVITALKYLQKPFLNTVWNASVQESENLIAGKVKSNVWTAYIKNIQMVNYVGMNFFDSDFYKEKVVYDKMAIMSQAKAKYSAYDIGHYALGMGAYSTSTSPIRRLSDTINQRIFKDSLHYGVDYARKKWSSITPYIAKLATDAELRAVKAEHRLDDIRKAEFMKQYEKQDFEVIVSDIKENFIIVLYPERMVYGKLFYNNRYFHLGKDGYSIMGHNGEKIMIGDIFNARLTKVNILNGEVVFSKGISEINEIEVF